MAAEGLSAPLVLLSGLVTLLSAAASVFGRLITGTTAGGLIEALGYVPFYLLTTLAAVPGIVLYLWLMRSGAITRSLGDAGRG